jgi:hypothetical protein
MKITINMSKAKEIHRNNIRLARAPKFQELDFQFQKELERGSDSNTKPIIDKKQKLRDLPDQPDIDEAKTLEELKKVWDENLLGPSPYTPASTKKVRARKVDGTFNPDDPSTPDVNEAWVGG